MNEAKPTCGWNESKPYRPPESEPPVRSSDGCSALFACPFCGSERVELRYYNQPSVVCLDCLAVGPASERLLRFESNKQQCAAQATALWNRRERLR